MNTITNFFLLATLLFLVPLLSFATRPEPESSGPFTAELNAKHTNPDNKGGSGSDPGFGGIFGPGPGFDIPGFGNGIVGGGYGSGFGGPSGGYSKGGILRPSVVCKDRGPCYHKKLTCPAKCFTSTSGSGKGYGGGGGGGGCTMDCKKKCIAYC